MSDTFQVILVTAVAAAALFVLLRPLLRRNTAPAKAGCDGCALAKATPGPARGGVSAVPPASGAALEFRRPAGSSQASR